MTQLPATLKVPLLSLLYIQFCDAFIGKSRRNRRRVAGSRKIRSPDCIKRVKRGVYIIAKNKFISTEKKERKKKFNDKFNQNYKLEFFHLFIYLFFFFSRKLGWSLLSLDNPCPRIFTSTSFQDILSRYIK